MAVILTKSYREKTSWCILFVCFFFFFVDISKKNFSQVNCLDKSTKELSFTARFQQLQMKQEEHNV